MSMMHVAGATLAAGIIGGVIAERQIHGDRPKPSAFPALAVGLGGGAATVTGVALLAKFGNNPYIVNGARVPGATLGLLATGGGLLAAALGVGAVIGGVGSYLVRPS